MYELLLLNRVKIVTFSFLAKISGERLLVRVLAKIYKVFLLLLFELFNIEPLLLDQNVFPVQILIKQSTVGSNK